MPFFNAACENVGKDLLLIKDNKVIGEAWSATMYLGIVGVHVRGERAEKFVEDHPLIKLWGESFPDKKFRYSIFHFDAYTGEHWPREEIEANLEGVRIVDKDLLIRGFVPDTFKEVEGYRSMLKDLHK